MITGAALDLIISLKEAAGPLDHVMEMLQVLEINSAMKSDAETREATLETLRRRFECAAQESKDE